MIPFLKDFGARSRLALSLPESPALWAWSFTYTLPEAGKDLKDKINVIVLERCLIFVFS